MGGRTISLLDLFGVAMVVLVFGAAGGAWGVASDHAVLAAHFERSASAPLYDLIAGAAARLPVGEPVFRLGVANAILGAALLCGVARAAQLLLPKDPVTGWIAALLLAIAPPFRDAAGFPGPAMLASCGAVWTVVAMLEHAGQPSRSRALAVFAGVAVTVGAAPWLGLALGGWAAARLRGDRTTLAIGIGAIGAIAILLWLGAIGNLPVLDFDLSALVGSTGRGAATIVVGAGLLGAGFAAATGLRHARWLAAAIAIAALHAAVVERAGLPVLALLAIGIAVIPSAIVRAIGPQPTERRRHLIGALAGVPLLGIALVSGAAIGIDDPNAAPARVATELVGAQPAGPGVVFATRPPAWSAIQYQRAVAGVRPDLELSAPVDPADASDALVTNGLRQRLIVASDAPAFGRLDLRLAYPRGRGYQLLPEPPPDFARAIPPPAHYRSEIGAQLSVLFAIDRARYEAVSGRLGAAARAAGLTERFGAADLAILSTTAPSRPAFFGFVPDLDHLPPGQWMLDLLGDDLAWSAGIDLPPPTGDLPHVRILHGLWRALWRGEIKPDDPQIAALGPDAVRATDELIETFKKNRR